MKSEFEEYNEWVTGNNLPIDLSAEEMLVETYNDKYITAPEQRIWLQDFIERWES